jgi:hypothetical protein
MIPKPAPDVILSGNRFLEKVLLKQQALPALVRALRGSEDGENAGGQNRPEVRA